MESSNTKSLKKTAPILALVACVLAILRYFLKGWVEPLGIPTVVGSLLASVTVVLVIGLVLIFLREVRSAEGRYVKAAVWFFALAVWCEALVIGGILITERTGANTYYQGPWEMVHERFPTGAAHAIGHTQGFFLRAAIWQILGAIIYAVVK